MILERGHEAHPSVLSSTMDKAFMMSNVSIVSCLYESELSRGFDPLSELGLSCFCLSVLIWTCFFAALDARELASRIF